MTEHTADLRRKRKAASIEPMVRLGWGTTNSAELTMKVRITVKVGEIYVATTEPS